MATSITFLVWQASWIFDLMIFFQKIQQKVLDMEIQLILSLGVALKNRSKVKKLSESIKNVTKLKKHEFEISYDRNCSTNT